MINRGSQPFVDIEVHGIELTEQINSPAAQEGDSGKGEIFFFRN